MFLFNSCFGEDFEIKNKVLPKKIVFLIPFDCLGEILRFSDTETFLQFLKIPNKKLRDFLFLKQNRIFFKNLKFSFLINESKMKSIKINKNMNFVNSAILKFSSESKFNENISQLLNEEIEDLEIHYKNSENLSTGMFQGLFNLKKLEINDCLLVKFEKSSFKDLQALKVLKIICSHQINESPKKEVVDEDYGKTLVPSLSPFLSWDILEQCSKTLEKIELDSVRGLKGLKNCSNLKKIIARRTDVFQVIDLGNFPKLEVIKVLDSNLEIDYLEENFKNKRYNLKFVDFNNGFLMVRNSLDDYSVDILDFCKKFEISINYFKKGTRQGRGELIPEDMRKPKIFHYFSKNYKNNFKPYDFE